MVECAENFSIEFVRVAARETGLLGQFTEAPQVHLGSWVTSSSSEPGKALISHALSCTVLSEWTACASVFLRCTEHPHEWTNVPFFAVLNLEPPPGRRRGGQGVATGPGIRQAGPCLVLVHLDQADMEVV